LWSPDSHGSVDQELGSAAGIANLFILIADT
jgi:hypothetical protein